MPSPLSSKREERAGVRRWLRCLRASQPRTAEEAEDVPDASRGPGPADLAETLAAVLQALHDAGALPADTPFDAGVAAWLRALAEPSLGPTWCAAHLPAAPAVPLAVPQLSPGGIVAAYGALQDRTVELDGAHVRLAGRPFARRQAGAFYTPPALIELVLDEALDAGDLERAREIRDAALPFMAFREEAGEDNAIPNANSVPALKAGLEFAGLTGGPVREPLVDLSDAEYERARTLYDDLAAFIDAEL